MQRIIEVSEICTHIQDQRKEGVLRTNTLFFELLTFLQKKYDWHEEYTYYLTSEELLLFLDGKKVDWKMVAKRCEEGVFGLAYNGKVELFTPQQYDSILTINHLFKEEKSVKQLQGTIAFQGKVTGKVRVLRNSKEIAQFLPGENIA